jgi:hypothetical protein
MTVPSFLRSFFLGEPEAEEFADPVGRQPPQADFTASLEDLVDREMNV